MVYPKDKIRHFKRTRSRWFGSLFIFSIGAFFNLIPFIDFSLISSVTEIQWLFLGIDTTLLFISFIIYMYYWFRIRGIKKEIVKD